MSSKYVQNILNLGRSQQFVLPYLFLRHEFFLAEMEATGNTFGNASRLKSQIDAIFAQIAFDRDAIFLDELRHPPGTGVEAQFAAYAFFGFHEDNTVFGTLLHGVRGAGGDAPGCFAVKTGDEAESHSGDLIHDFWANLVNPAQTGTVGKFLVGLTVNFTRVTADAFIHILKDHVITHTGNPPPS